MKSLIEKIEYCLEHSENETKLQTMFQPTEWDVLLAMKEYKQCLRQIEKNSSQEKTDVKRNMERQLERMDEEKETILLLREKMLLHLDVLLAIGTIEAWCEILVWYRFVIQEKLATRFWEFYILKIVLDIFVKECNKGMNISVLHLNSMKEINEIYFKTVFLLRRIEYEIEPMDELADFVAEQRLSFLFVQGVLKEAQICDKNKVKQVIEGWCWNDIK